MPVLDEEVKILTMGGKSITPLRAHVRRMPNMGQSGEVHVLVTALRRVGRREINTTRHGRKTTLLNSSTATGARR